MSWRLSILRKLISDYSDDLGRQLTEADDPRMTEIARFKDTDLTRRFASFHARGVRNG